MFFTPYGGVEFFRYALWFHSIGGHEHFGGDGRHLDGVDGRLIHSRGAAFDDLQLRLQRFATADRNLNGVSVSCQNRGGQIIRPRGRGFLELAALLVINLGVFPGP